MAHLKNESIETSCNMIPLVRRHGSVNILVVAFKPLELSQ